LIQFTAALLLGIGAAGAPGLTYAQHMGSGGMGGGGHMGGAHMGGAHMGGGGGAHFGGARMGFSPGYSPGRVMGGYYGHGAYPGASHYGYAGGVHGYAGAHVGYPASRVGYVGHPVAGHGSAYYYGGHYWGGGYWHGAYWPYCYYHPGFIWYYPVLPIGYATFWWGGLPYYYWNNLYYTWNPGYNGYVVTDPPPVEGADEYGSGDPSSVTAEPQGAPAAGAAGAGADIYVYPRNGQTDAQTSSDRYECHSWAVNQTGFDPTRGTQNGGTPADYKRAMIACLDARGYSAR
jgi:hypothetical protein